MDLQLPFLLTLSFYVLIAWALTATFAGFRILAGDNVQRALWMRGLMVAWLGFPAYLAIRGAFWDFDDSPPTLLRLTGFIVVVVTAFSFSPWGKATAAKLPESLLVGTQGFRLPLEIILYSLAGRHVIAQEMTFRGYNFDIITGLLALPLWWNIRKLTAPKWVLWAWNGLGLSLLLTLIGVSILSFPQPFGWFMPPNVAVAAYPWVWLLTFLVPLALCSHLLLFRKLMIPAPKRGPNI